jgi:hypothetical protein
VASGRAALDGPHPAPDLAAFPAAARPAPDRRPPASPDTLASGTVLGTWSAHFRADRHTQYLDDVRESLAVYRELRCAHPGWVLRTANWILSDNVRLGPWIHVGSTVRNLGLITDGAEVETRAIVRAEYEKKGHRFVDLDVVVMADGVPVATIDHTAIYRPRQVAEAS